MNLPESVAWVAAETFVLVTCTSPWLWVAGRRRGGHGGERRRPLPEPPSPWDPSGPEEDATPDMVDLELRALIDAAGRVAP